MFKNRMYCLDNVPGCRSIVWPYKQIKISRQSHQGNLCILSTIIVFLFKTFITSKSFPAIQVCLVIKAKGKSHMITDLMFVAKLLQININNLGHVYLICLEANRWPSKENFP